MKMKNIWKNRYTCYTFTDISYLEHGQETDVSKKESLAKIGTLDCKQALRVFSSHLYFRQRNYSNKLVFLY